MATAKQSPSLTTHWTGHIQRWQRTEQTQSAYCRDQNLSYHRFNYWRRKLTTPSKLDQNPARFSAFVPVKTCLPVVVRELSLTLPGGMVLQGITSGNLPLVKQLLSALR